MQFDEVLRTWKTFFETEGIRYGLAGGQALRAWGHSRATYDVDFVVDGQARLRVITRAQSIGYVTTFVSEGYSNHHHPSASVGHVDFIYVYGRTAEAIFDASTSRGTVGVDLPVASPEHLIAMKVRAMKNRPMRVLIDAPDIAFLLSLPQIDRERAREYFAQHGLLQIYEQMEKQRNG